MQNHSADPTVAVLRASYGPLRELVSGLGESDSWLPTGCEGWAARDLTHHHLGDARRALVALHNPRLEPPDRDAVTYWQDWAPEPIGAADGLRFTRVGASMFTQFEPLRELYLETTAAVLHAAAASGPEIPVATQGHVLLTRDLLSTLAVEATLHHLDFLVAVPDAARPDPVALAHVRTILDGLLGQPVPLPWDDEHYALAATGRTALTAAERLRIGGLASRFPLFS
ncbi:MAG: hypothetical protein QOG52_749 [Frankiaceae bacterium]|nr:hypothetical protein [Frankiaceae bacterium]